MSLARRVEVVSIIFGVPHHSKGNTWQHMANMGKVAAHFVKLFQKWP